MTVKVAIICSGHARMVPYGWKMIWDRVAQVPEIDARVFSFVWDDHSDNRMQNVTDLVDDWRCQPDTDQIFRTLGSRHHSLEQLPIMDDLYQRYLAHDAIPGVLAEDQFYLPRQLFDRFNGQLVGFVLALDHWRRELSGYDYIVRSRWDMVLDVECLRRMLSPKEQPAPPTFYTKYIDITHGHPQISGDTIYGPRAAWFDVIPSWEYCRQQLIEGTRARWQWIQQHCRPQDLEDDYNIKYYTQGWWFNTHFLWTTVFRSSSQSIIKALGESYGLHPSLTRIPLDQFCFNHAALGLYWRPDGGQVPESKIPPRPVPQIVADQRAAKQGRRIEQLRQRMQS